MDVDLLFDPLAPPRYCPQCARVGIKTTVKKFKVKTCSADLVIMCKNEKCPWPFSVRSPTEATVRLELPVLIQRLGLHEISKSKKDPAWLKSMALNAGPVVLLQGDNPDCQLSLPVLLLVAISPLVRNILSADQLPPSFSTPVISIPSLSVDILESVGKMLVSGTASMDMSRLCGVRDVFKMMGIEDRMMIYKDSVNTVGNDEVHGDMDVDHLYLFEESLRDDQTEGVVHDQTNTNNEDINGNVFVNNINDVPKNLVSIKSEECVQDDPENENIEIVVKLEEELKVEDPVFNNNTGRVLVQETVDDIDVLDNFVRIKSEDCFKEGGIDLENATLELVNLEKEIKVEHSVYSGGQSSQFGLELKKSENQNCENPVFLPNQGAGHSGKYGLELQKNADKTIYEKTFKTRNFVQKQLKVHIARLKHGGNLEKYVVKTATESKKEETKKHPFSSKIVRDKYSKLTKKSCPHCEKSVTLQHMSQHIRRAHNKETVQCPICDKRLVYTGLKKHIKQVHNETMLTCPQCEKKLSDLSLSRHINKETTQCRHCDKTLSYTSLKDHIKTSRLW